MPCSGTKKIHAQYFLILLTYIFKNKYVVYKKMLPVLAAALQSWQNIKG